MAEGAQAGEAEGTRGGRVVKVIADEGWNDRVRVLERTRRVDQSILIRLSTLFRWSLRASETDEVLKRVLLGKGFGRSEEAGEIE